MTRDRQPSIRVSRFVFQGCGCGHEKGGMGASYLRGRKEEKEGFSSVQTSCEERERGGGTRSIPPSSKAG
jgi:hypothetical protein